MGSASLMINGGMGRGSLPVAAGTPRAQEAPRTHADLHQLGGWPISPLPGLYTTTNNALSSVEQSLDHEDWHADTSGVRHTGGLRIGLMQKILSGIKCLPGHASGMRRQL